MEHIIYTPSVDLKQHIIATYWIKSKTNVEQAAWDIAIGQSVGNPNVRNNWETSSLYEQHACKILTDRELLQGKKDAVRIAFPLANLNLQEDGISQLMCQLMGGQLDIDIIEECKLLHLYIPDTLICYQPKYGISGIRQYTQVQNKPLLGGIIKPKIGLSYIQLLDMVKQLADGGVNFIKEDEIMSSPACCPLQQRVEPICNYLANHAPNIIYAFCINGDYPYVVNRMHMIHNAGGNAVHVNFWCGLGVYKALRGFDLPMFLFFQKSGDKILTNIHNKFSISWRVICKLAGIMGVDFIHAGMWGGYSTTDDYELRDTMQILHHYKVMPSLSCGMHPGLVNKITDMFGTDYMANVGGAIHGHPEGTLAGVRAMRQAIDKEFRHEYYVAVDKWGLVE